MDQISISHLLASMAEKWPSAWVARTEIEKFSGGLISEKYIANLDSSGKGPEGRFRCGRKICYPVPSLIKFFLSRSEMVK